MGQYMSYTPEPRPRALVFLHGDGYAEVCAVGGLQAMIESFVGLPWSEFDTEIVLVNDPGQTTNVACSALMSLAADFRGVAALEKLPECDTPQCSYIRLAAEAGARASRFRGDRDKIIVVSGALGLHGLQGTTGANTVHVIDPHVMQAASATPPDYVAPPPDLAVHN